MKPLILIGAGGHTRSVIDVIEKSGIWNVIGLIGLKEEIGREILGYPIIGTDNDLMVIRKKCDNAHLAIGQLPSADKRIQLAHYLKKLTFSLPTIISPHAIISRYAQLGEGSFIGHGAIINSNAIVGKNCIINSMALLEHDAKIEDFCHISTGALVNGGVRIGANSFIGSGAMIREGLELPNDTVITAQKRVMGWPLL